MIYFGSNAVIAQFVKDLSLTLKPVSPSITIIVRGRSEDCFAYIATDTLSDAIVATVASNFSWPPIDISTGRTLAGQFRRK
jgi:hypothetical protein